MDSDEANSLLSDLAVGKLDISKRFSAYLKPLHEPRHEEDETRSLTLKFYPFLTEAFKILPKKLTSFVKANEEVARECFSVYKLCLDSWEFLLKLSGNQLLAVDYRVIFLKCLVKWSLWEEGELEALTIFEKLKPANSSNVYLPNADPQAKYKSAIAKAVGFLCQCVAHYKPKQPEPYVRLHQIVTEFQPWIGVMDTGYHQLGLKDLMTQLLNITSNLVAEVYQLDIAQNMCNVIITTPVQGTQHLTKLCNSLHQIGGHMHSNQDFEQASEVFKLHCHVTWAIIEARLKDAGTDDSLVFFGKWCEGIQSLFQVCDYNPHQVQGLIKGWTEKWTADEFCTALPGPISLVEQWVKIQLEIVKHEGNGDDAGILLANGFLSRNKVARKKILQQELLFYVQMQNENSNFCETMQRMIRNLLEKDGFDKAFDWFEELRSLSLCGIKGPKYCIHYLSQAMEVSSGHQLAMAYALRSLCIDEYEPNSERVIQDIRSALSVWSSMTTSDHSMEPGNLMNILYSILDLLSLKGQVDLQCDLYRVMIGIYTRRGVPLKNLLVGLWESRRISHALCPSPIQEPFINLEEYFGQELKSTDFWEQCCVASRQLLVGYNCNFSPSKSTVDEVEKIASGLISTGSVYSASCIYYDLSEKMVSNGHLIEALRYAMQAHRLRVKLLGQKFPWPSEEYGGEYNETGRHMLVGGLSASELWSFDTNLSDFGTCYVSPWKALECYLESLLQTGIIHEILGDAHKAESLLDQGKSLSCSYSLTLFKIAFSSCLGQLHHKRECWASADGFCSKCRSILEVTVANNLGDLYQNPKYKSESTTSGLCTTDHYKEALAKLYTSEWKMSITGHEDQDVLTDDDYSMECGFPNYLCQNKSEWDLDLHNCVASLGSNAPCICQTKDCWHCVSETCTRFGSVTDAIKLKWELVHRRLSHKLLTGLGKYLENDGKIHEACEVICQSISVIVGPSPFCRASKSSLLPNTMGTEISDQRKHLNLYHLLGREIAGDVLCLERAQTLHNLCWLSLKERKKNPRNKSHVLIDIPTSKLVSWLMLAFILSREVPAVLRKVVRLLAVIFSLSPSVLEASLSTSFQELCQRHWASFFHQASVGAQFNYQFPIKIINQHANTEVSHMELEKLPRFAPDSIVHIVDFVKDSFSGLPSTTVVCLSILGYPYGCLLPDSASAWIMMSRLNHNTSPIHIVLPAQPLLGDAPMYPIEKHSEEWCCPWGSTIIDDVLPRLRFLMKEISMIARQQSPSSSSMALKHRIESDLCQMLGNIESTWFARVFTYIFLGELMSTEVVDRICKDILGADIDISSLRVILPGLLDMVLD